MTVMEDGKRKSIQYLDSIEYGENLDNPYNNYVNPLYLWDVLTPEGRTFFLDFYKEYIECIIREVTAKADRAKEIKDTTVTFWTDKICSDGRI